MSRNPDPPRVLRVIRSSQGYPVISSHSAVTLINVQCSIFKGAIADDGSKHTISKEEQRSFAQWINGHFAEVNLKESWNQVSFILFF